MGHNKCSQCWINCEFQQNNLRYEIVHIFCITISYWKIIVGGATMFDCLSNLSCRQLQEKDFLCAQSSSNNMFFTHFLLKPPPPLEKNLLKFVCILCITTPNLKILIGGGTTCDCASFHSQTQFQKECFFCCTMKLQSFVHNTVPLQTSSPLAHSCWNLFICFEHNFQITKLILEVISSSSSSSLDVPTTFLHWTQFQTRASSI